jgi:hypothetical protein
MEINQISKGQFPKEGKYVLIYCGGSSWIDDDCNVYWNVAKFVKGISVKERSTLSQSDNIDDQRRSKTYMFGDEEGNNKVSYAFKEFGPSQWFGQDIEFWCELPDVKPFLNK